MTISVKLSPSHRLVEELSAEVRLYPLYLMFWESRLVDRYSLYLSDPVKFSHCKYPFNPPVEPKNPKTLIIKPDSPGQAAHEHRSAPDPQFPL